MRHWHIFGFPKSMIQRYIFENGFVPRNRIKLQLSICRFVKSAVTFSKYKQPDEYRDVEINHMPNWSRPSDTNRSILTCENTATKSFFLRENETVS